MGGGLILRIFLRSKWLLDLPDLEIFLSIMDFFNGKKSFFAKTSLLMIMSNSIYNIGYFSNGIPVWEGIFAL